MVCTRSSTRKEKEQLVLNEQAEQLARIKQARRVAGLKELTEAYRGYCYVQFNLGLAPVHFLFFIDQYREGNPRFVCNL